MRYLFTRIHGRIISIEAPVVPITLATMAPVRRKRTLTIGLDSPFTVM